MRTFKVGIVGLGYVGLPLAIAATKAGHSVVGIDIDLKRITSLNNRKSYIEDIHDHQVDEAINGGFIASKNFGLLSEVDITVICVPTPLDESGKPDLSNLEMAAKQIAHVVRDGTLIVNESTSFPGTVRNILPKIMHGTKANLGLLFACAPERIDPANKIWTITNTPRLVSGLDEKATSIAVDFYGSFCENVVKVTKPEIAEFAKLLENTYRLINISLLNEMVPLAKNLGISLHEVVNSASTKPYGYTPFFPSIGVGGHCIPVDPVYLHQWAKDLEVELNIVGEAIKVNEKLQNYIISICDSVKESCRNQVLVFGISYKEGVADTRQSASLDLIRKLQDLNWNVKWWDQHVNSPTLKIDEFRTLQYLSIITQKIADKEVERIALQANYIIDSTGFYKDFPKVFSF